MYHRNFLLIVIALVLFCSQAPRTMEQTALITHHDIAVTLNPDNHTIKGTDKITAKFSPQVTGNEVVFYMNPAIKKVTLVDSSGLSLEKIPDDEALKKLDRTLDSNKNLFQYYVVKLDHPDSVVNFILVYEGVIYDTLKTLAQEYARGFATTTGLIDTPGVTWLVLQAGFQHNLVINLPFV